MTDPQERPIDHQELLRQAIDLPGGDAARQPRAPEPEELAPHFPDYEILALIGRGGMGAVYKAVQRKLDRVVALKVLPREFAADPEFGERFLREARALASLNHPHVLTVHDFGESDGLYYLVTEFVDGVNLRQLMELGELSPAEALRITPQLCTALQYAHEHGVVHRDVKPENILIDTNGQVKIADFGLAKLVRANDPVGLTRSTAVFGTPHYMAPEQWRGSGAVDHRADIYSLGVVLYEMLTGQLPLGHFDPPSQRAGVPRGLDEVVRRTLAQQPENRYQHARDVQTDVELQARSMPRPPRARAAAPAGGRLAKGPFVAVGLVLAGIVAAFAAAFVMSRAQMNRHRYENRLEQYDATVQAIADAARAGQEWAGELPTLPTPASEVSVFWTQTASILVATGVLASVLSVMVLGFWSVRRIRNSGGKLRGVPFAVFSAWLVPLGLVNALMFTPVAMIRDNDTQILAGVFLGLLVAAGDVWFLVRETQRQRALVDAGTPQRTGAGLLWTGAVIAALLVVGGIGASYLLERTEVAEVREPAPTLPRDLIGRRVEYLVDRLGPPESIQASRNGQVWSYRDAKGELSNYAATISGDHVVGTDSSVGVLMPNARPARGPYLGQPVLEVTLELGPPESVTQGAIGQKFRYADGLELAVHDGRVIAIERD